MKIKSIFIMSLAMAFVGCTSDMDECINSQERKIDEMRAKILSISEEYGVSNNVIVTDDVVKRHLNDTEDDIAYWMKSIANVKGAFVGSGFDFSCTVSSSDLNCSWTLICNYSGESLGCFLN